MSKRLPPFRAKNFRLYQKYISDNIRAQVPETAGRVSCVIILATNFGSVYSYLFHISEKFGPTETIADRKEIRNIDVLNKS